MNKKGFTLVELLAVIVILAVILTIAVPNMFKIIDKSKQDSYDNQVLMIIDAAKNYVVNESKVVTTEEPLCIDVTDQLVGENYLDEMPKDPRDGTVMAGSVAVTVDANDKYDYEYNDTACTP